jgi:hypothetical protein
MRREAPMFDKDGLYMSHGADGRVLTVVEDMRRTLWIRYFATKDSVLDILEDEVLDGHERDAMASYLNVKKGFYTDAYNVPPGGFKSHAFMKYVLES